MSILKAAAAFGFVAVFGIAGAPQVSAADLDATVRKPVRMVHHHRSRVVRDYDGTAVIERRVRRIEPGPAGTLVAVDRVEMISVPRATPRTYLNGEPVLPNGSRYLR